MRAILHLVFLAVLLVRLAPPAMADAGDAAAVDLVNNRQLGGNLKTLALAAAQSTQTYAMLVARLGAPEAQSLLVSELDAQAARFPLSARRCSANPGRC